MGKGIDLNAMVANKVFGKEVFKSKPTKRSEKYPDTDTFHFYNANPHNRITSDCVIRALCTALEIPYNQVVIEMAELQCKTGFDPSESTTINKYLVSKGWIKMPQPRKWDNTKYTGKEWCKLLQQKGDNRPVVANIGGHHTVAIIDGQVYDHWNSTDGCIGNYWIKR